MTDDIDQQRQYMSMSLCRSSSCRGIASSSASSWAAATDEGERGLLQANLVEKSLAEADAALRVLVDAGDHDCRTTPRQRDIPNVATAFGC